MKKLIILIIVTLFTLPVFAQAPQKMSYQAVIRNSSNALITSNSIGMRVSILQGSITGTEVYKEIYNPNPQTNANGLVTLEIGAGIPLIGTFATINWANGTYYIKTETDPTGGTNYTITGVSQILSVPYAQHAKTAESLTGVITETDPIYSVSQAANITANDIIKLNNLSGTNTGDQDLSGKVDKVTGKGLSTNDYTDVDATKVTNLSGTNTGDETDATIKAKLAITTLSGSNTGDQDLSNLVVKGASNSITSTMITDGSVSSADISDGTISSADVNTASIQVRVSGSAPDGQYITQIFSNGSIATAVDNNTVYTGSGGIKLTSTNFTLDGPVSTVYGGTGQSTYTNGQLLIGNTTGNTLTKSTLTKGDGINITNGNGSITIASDIGTSSIQVAAGNHTHTNATTSANGLMSSTDKTKLDGIATGAEVNVNADWNATSGDAQILNKPTIPTALSIGQSYQGGIIFWLDATGQHGLIAATADQSTGIQWYNGALTTTNAVRDGIGAGKYNTERIIAIQSVGSYAAQLCANYQGGGYGDWYLPSKFELNLLYQQKAAVGGFASAWYGSSTEGSMGNTWVQTFDYGGQGNYAKSGPFYVRAVRAF